MQNTPNETKKHHCVSVQMSTALRRTESLGVISVLSPWPRVEGVSSHPSIFPPTPICLEQLKFHKTPTTYQIMPRFHSLSVSCALTMCQAFLQALEYKEKTHGAVTLQRQGKSSSTSNEMDIFLFYQHCLIFVFQSSTCSIVQNPEQISPPSGRLPRLPQKIPILFFSTPLALYLDLSDHLSQLLSLPTTV